MESYCIRLQEINKGKSTFLLQELVRMSTFWKVIRREIQGAITKINVQNSKIYTEQHVQDKNNKNVQSVIRANCITCNHNLFKTGEDVQLKVQNTISKEIVRSENTNREDDKEEEKEDNGKEDKKDTEEGEKISSQSNRNQNPKIKSKFVISHHDTNIFDFMAKNKAQMKGFSKKHIQVYGEIRKYFDDTMKNHIKSMNKLKVKVDKLTKANKILVEKVNDLTEENKKLLRWSHLKTHKKKYRVKQIDNKQ